MRSAFAVSLNALVLLAAIDSVAQSEKKDPDGNSRRDSPIKVAGW
jgi:hypothetical protein